MIDTGSNKNYIQPNLVKNSIPNNDIFYATSVGGKIKITHHTFIDLFGLKDENLKFFVLPTLKSFHGILGNDSLKQLEAIIFTSKNHMLIKNKIKIAIKQQNATSVNNVGIRTTHLTDSQAEKLRNLCQLYPKLFSEPDEKLTYTTVVKATIRTTTDNPVYSRCYPYPMSLKSEVERQINKLLEDGIIRPSRSPYNSPVWIVDKKPDSLGNKQYRLVIDYRKLNSVTIADRYPIPEINEVLSHLGSNTFFSVIDLKSGFHQIPLKSSDIEKTAFSINNGKYEFTRLPFGLKNAPSIFQRTLDDILRDYIGQCCYVYIDDIIIFSRNEKEHSTHLKNIFTTLEKANMKVQLDKCKFFEKEVEFLGFIVTPEGIKTNPSKIEAIQNFPIPRNLKELRSFLGLSGYYRRFVKDYAKLAKPLTALLRGEEGRVSKSQSARAHITLGDEALAALEKIKNVLISRDVMLTYPNLNKDFELTTDASNYAIGAVLSQEDRPITFISRTLTKTEENYAANEKEMLAIIWALKSLRNYLYGSAKVKIFTDHQPLTYALSNKNNNSKMKRWKAILEEYNYELKYKPGKTNVVADGLSRPPQQDQINSLTPTQHSDESSPQNLIPYTDAPINAFKNQLFLKTADTSSYQFLIPFPTYHRHIIEEPEYTEENLTNHLKRYLNPSVTNAIITDDHILGRIQNIHPIHFSRYRIKYTRKIVKDLVRESEQESEIVKEHKRAHRSATENKAQILENFYFPQMNSKINKIIKQCKICLENKYERHPSKLVLKATPVPNYPGHIVHIDIYHTNNRVILTAVDKFSKYAQARIVKSRATEDIKLPLQDLLTSFGIPEKIVIDNEKSLNSSSIVFMLENQYSIEIFKTPPYTSSVNGQVERFHSTLTEIMRCTKAENTHNSFEELLNRSICKYNHSIHSTTKKKPIEIFFGRSVYSDPSLLEKDRLDNIKKIVNKQEKDLTFHNKKRTEVKAYSSNDIIYVKINKRIGNKLTPRYKKEIVLEDNGNTVTTKSGRSVHKSHIKAS